MCAKRICSIMKVWFFFPREVTELIYNWGNEKRAFASFDFECSSTRNLGVFLFWFPIFLGRKDVTEIIHNWVNDKKLFAR